MTGTTDLRHEHKAVGRMLDIIDGMAASFRQGEPLNADDLSETIEFLRVFVDKCHHTKEEQLLFPAIRQAGITDADNVLVMLLAEHVQGRETVAAIAAAAQRAVDAGVSASIELAETLTGYTRLLRAHIAREESDCFGPADIELPQAVQDGLVHGYARIEAEVVGEGVHEGFHALLDRLSATYRT